MTPFAQIATRQQARLLAAAWLPAAAMAEAAARAAATLSWQVNAAFARRSDAWGPARLAAPATDAAEHGMEAAADTFETAAATVETAADAVSTLATPESVGTEDDARAVLRDVGGTMTAADEIVTGALTPDAGSKARDVTAQIEAATGSEPKSLDAMVPPKNPKPAK
ncbi:hypothetical protein [Jannaschia sp. W003]|uniref:hypothetical protein n=1 Tax=Jannaschia sp. W003 TaxID=2867012 RepID=UPI0021A27F5B|nr:hypothetical protein [Jannaschia sp. W003]UWQ22225.1 hypothetical protein K3554_04105 [Jannaschia sp. W003]